MLPFHNKLNNDNPISDDLNLKELRTWYFALLLIGSNLFGLPLLIRAHTRALRVLAVTTFWAIFLSVLYHTCQTTGVCFGLDLARLTLADHISAPIFMIGLILFIIDSRSARQIAYTRRWRQQQQARVLAPQTSAATYHYGQADREGSPLPLPSPPRDYARLGWRDPGDVYLSEAEFVAIQEAKTYYALGQGHVEPNTLGSAWDVYILVSLIFVVVLATLAHPFSMEAFVIVICFALVAIFFKICVIEEGVPVNMYERVYLPDLLVGVALLVVALVFYILDTYVAYAYFHSFWHDFSFLGGYYLVIGLSRNIEGWYSPTYWLYARTVRCCLNQSVEADDPAFVPGLHI